jgi:glycosyltransferase involved in cell wall biosynthesis
MAGSFALMYMSIFEGFGVPPIEAMQCGVPVITSDTSSMPEICDAAALLADPLDVGAIARAITLLWTNPIIYGNLIRKGALQAQKYSWDRSASLLWASCLKAIGSYPSATIM